MLSNTIHAALFRIWNYFYATEVQIVELFLQASLILSELSLLPTCLPHSRETLNTANKKKKMDNVRKDLKTQGKRIKHFEILESGTKPRNKVVNIFPTMQTLCLSEPLTQAVNSVIPGRAQSGWITSTSFHFSGGKGELQGTQERRRQGRLWGLSDIQPCSVPQLRVQPVRFLKFTQSAELKCLNSMSLLSPHAQPNVWLFSRPNLLAL